MSGRRLAVIGIAVCIAIATWSLWDTVPARSTPPNGEDRGGAAHRDAISAVDAKPAVEARAEPEAAQRRDGSATAAASAGISAAQVQVRVLGIDGTPEAGVTVRYVASDLFAPRQNTGPSAPYDFEEMLRQIGTTVTTGDDGMVRWPWRAKQYARWFVGARRADAWGAIEISATQRPDVVKELRLARDGSFAVHLVTADGAPAVAVPLRAGFTERQANGTEEEVDKGASTTTDAAGFGVFRHVQQWSGRIAPRGDKRPFVVSVHSPGVAVTADMDAIALPTAPVELRLPATGSVRLVVRDAFGGPVFPGTYVRMREDPWDGMQVEGCLNEPDALVIHHVGLGKRWKAWVAPDGVEAVFDGPREPGETITFELQTRPCPTLHGTLLLDGAPRADAGCDAAGFERVLGWMPRTDAAGRFWLPLRAHHTGTTIKRLTIYTGEGFDRDGFEAVWNGELQLEARQHDLGTLVLKRGGPRPVLVAGKVLSDKENLADLHLDIERRGDDKDWPEGKPSIELDHATGEFTFRGTSPDVELNVLVDREGRRWPSRVRVGETDVEIDLLDHEDGLVAQFPGVGRDLAMCLVPALFDEISDENDLEQGDAQCERHFGARGVSYEWKDVLPGAYRLVVRTNGSRTTLLRIADLVVPPSGRCDDARLDKLMLPPVQTFAITVPSEIRFGPRGLEPSPVALLENDRVVGEAFEDTAGRCLIATDKPVDLRIRVLGYRERVLRAVFADTTVTLDPAIIVDLALDTAGLPPHKSRTVTAWLENSLEDTLRVRASEHEGRYRLLLPCPGRYGLTAWLWNDGQELPEVSCDPGQIDVTDAGGTVAVRASVSK